MSAQLGEQIAYRSWRRSIVNSTNVDILKNAARISERLSTIAALIRLAMFDAAFPHQLHAHLVKESLFIVVGRPCALARISRSRSTGRTRR
jgi:hypothetical protein